jgi:hypothetical protein
MPLPKGVHTSHGRYFLVRSGRWIPLSLVGEGPAALRAALSSVPATDDQLPPRNVGELLQRFLSSGLDELSPATRHGYTVAINSQLIPSFGDAPIDGVEPGDVSSPASRWLRFRPSRALISGPFIQGSPALPLDSV